MLMSWIQPNNAQVKYIYLFIVSSASDSILDKNTIADYHYQGYPLRNYGAFNVYSQVTADECQYLCQISDLCQYFNYILKTDANVGKVVTLYDVCYLKFGVGKKKEKTDGAFGYKYSLGER